MIYKSYIDIRCISTVLALFSNVCQLTLQYFLDNIKICYMGYKQEGSVRAKKLPLACSDIEDKERLTRLLLGRSNQQKRIFQADARLFAHASEA